MRSTDFSTFLALNQQRWRESNILIILTKNWWKVLETNVEVVQKYFDDFFCLKLRNFHSNLNSKKYLKYSNLGNSFLVCEVIEILSLWIWRLREEFEWFSDSIWRDLPRRHNYPLPFLRNSCFTIRKLFYFQFLVGSSIKVYFQFKAARENIFIAPQNFIIFAAL